MKMMKCLIRYAIVRVVGFVVPAGVVFVRPRRPLLLLLRRCASCYCTSPNPNRRHRRHSGNGTRRERDRMVWAFLPKQMMPLSLSPAKK